MPAYEVHGRLYIGVNDRYADNSASSVVIVYGGSDLFIDGTVAFVHAVLMVGDVPGSSAYSTLYLGTTGHIYGQVGVVLQQSGYVIENNGVIYGTASAVGNENGINGIFKLLINHGTMTSGLGTDEQYHSNRTISTNAANGESSKIVNTGTIEALLDDSYAIIHSGNSLDTVLNSGTIVGNISLGVGDDRYDGQKGHLQGFVDAGAGRDTVIGGSDDDTLRGGDDADSLVGGSGDDILTGGTGIDTLDGGSGNDRFSIGTDTKDKIVDKSGNDTIIANASINLAKYPGIENVILSGFGSFTATGTSGANHLVGNYSSSKLDGGNGDDTLVGGKANDTLLGGSGKDDLQGGTGRDLLTGGASSDSFIFRATDSTLSTSRVDTITDWSTSDEIDTAIKGSTKNYYEHSVGSSVDTIEEAAAYAEANATGTAIKHAFLYNASKDIGFLLMDLNSTDGFDTGVILTKSGAAADFSYADLV